MSPFPTAYTPLESLLLFQSLRYDGVHPGSFSRISDHLNAIPLIRNDASYDAGRLSPDALRELYLRLLKDEVKQDLERKANNGSDDGLANGSSTPTSRKRKAASPPLLPVSDAAQHVHLIPQLVVRLYARYRENVVRHLREQERKYASLTRDIGEIEAGQWDERLQRQHAQTTTGPSPKPSSSAHTQPSLPRLEGASAAVQSSAAISPTLHQKQPEKPAATPPKRFSQAKIDAVINHGPEPDYSPGGHRRQTSNTTLPPLSEMAPQSPHFGVPPKMPASIPPQMQPMQSAPTPDYSQSPPIGHQSPFAPQHAHPRHGSTSNPQVQQSLSRPSSSPRPILPPPPGMKLPPVQTSGSPGIPQPPLQPHPHLPQQYPPQIPPPHRISAGSPSAGEMPGRGYAASALTPHGSGYYQQQQQFPDRRTSYPPQQQGQMFPTPLPTSGNYMPPPYSLGPQDLSMPYLAQQPRGQQTPRHVQRAHQYSASAFSTPATAPPRANPRLLADVLSALGTPSRQSVKPLWKSDLRPSTHAKPVFHQTSPAVEPLSPIFARTELSGRETRHAEMPSQDRQASADSEPKSRTSRRRRKARGRSPHSVVSSTAGESAPTRTRSQSVSTAAGRNQVPEDRPESRYGIKAEPFTPANALEDTDSPIGPSATSKSGPMTRKRRGTLQAAPLSPPKRKRQESPAATVDEGDDRSTPPARSDKVLATRNFVKTCSALLMDINSNKNAERFNKPAEKEVPGYSEIVYMPQDLRSIRTAITAGTRAVAAAIASADSPAATPTASSSRGGPATVELDRTIDVIPPKAIVNGAQLEKELMRMFANAFMFNPGEDGVAGVTKEFFEDVEQKINDWRNIERENTAADGEDEPKGKRRKA